MILKNNRPEAVLISSDQFEELLSLKEEIEEMSLGMEALKCLVTFNPDASILHDDILTEFGISHDDLNNIDVDLKNSMIFIIFIFFNNI